MIEAIDVRDLLDQPGASRTAEVSGELDALGTELASARPGEPFRASLLLESVVEGIYVSGRVIGTLALRCARCLTDFDRPIEIEVGELFALHPVGDSDTYPLDPKGSIEPEQMVRDVVGVELPFAPLCSPGCLGLCARCGGNRNLGECTCRDDEVDPRWSELEHVIGLLPDS